MRAPLFICLSSGGRHKRRRRALDATELDKHSDAVADSLSCLTTAPHGNSFNYVVETGLADLHERPD